MANTNYGDLEVFGVVTVGAKSSNASAGYTLPYDKGQNLSIMGIAPAPSATGLSGTMLQFLTPEQLNIVDNSTLQTTVADATAATLSAANMFSISILSDISVDITGANGIQVVEVTANKFIISLYTALTASLAVSPSTAEVGQSVPTANLTWSYNKPTAVVSQGISGYGYISPPTTTNYFAAGPFTTTKTFTLIGFDGTQSATSNATMTFLKKRYWGTIPASGSIPSNSQLLAGSNELSSTRSKSVTFNCAVPSGGNYFYYAYPTAYGVASTTVNGFPFSDWYNPSNPPVASTSPATISVTSAYGVIENYYLYRCYNVQNGSSIPVVFS
jgi:hypothetical protein